MGLFRLFTDWLGFGDGTGMHSSDSIFGSDMSTSTFDSFESSGFDSFDTNLANGLPMCGSVDIEGGNPFGCSGSDFADTAGPFGEDATGENEHLR